MGEEILRLGTFDSLLNRFPVPLFPKPPWGSVTSARPSACGTLDTPATSKAFQSSGKIDGNSVPEPLGLPHSVPDHLTSDRESRERDPKADHIRGCTPLTGLKSPVHCYATALLCNARAVACGLTLIRSRVKANPA